MADFTKVKEWIKDADAVIVTAGNGMAKEEGLDILSEENFDDQFGKIADKDRNGFEYNFDRQEECRQFFVRCKF